MSEAPSLNPAQRVAVDHPGGPLLVIAGAGSGKTRVLTARIRRLIEQGTPAEAVLAFTFTNRAAREMRHRIERDLGAAAQGLWIGTFHGTAMRLLRREARTLGLPPGFTIYDREDQEGVLREILKDLALPETGYRLGAVLGRISDAKNALVTPAQMERAALTPFEQAIAKCYRLYHAALRRAGALDFDDLIAETVRLFVEFPEAGERWSRRFLHVLVDEYQDTNHAQFRMVQSLAAVHGNVFVVGDDDQSIYGWRGADLANVLDFEQAFPGAETVRLEQNYRSTSNILNAANAVIANNRARKGKTLWTERGDGAPLTFLLAADEADEARRVRRFLEDGQRRGRRLDQTAVLYRTNAQSRALETELRHAGVPYEMVGGVSFYQRREVKDLLAYLRLVVNPSDVISFWRVWNTPRRALGPAVRALVEQRMAMGVGEPAEALRELEREGHLTRAARTGATQLLATLDALRAAQELPLDQVFAMLLEKSRYLEHLEATSEQDFEERRANLEELAASATAFDAEGNGGLLEFLSEASLLTDADRLAEGVDRVLLLTAHNAKGLEFDAVVIAGLEEGLMPHASSLEDAAELEEERRLFYVALTRARDQVLLTAAAYRRRFDGAWGGQVSRFVDEIPAALLVREESAGVSGYARGAGHRAGGATRATAWNGRARVVREERSVEHDDADGSMHETAGVGAATSRAEARRAVGRTVYHDTFGRGVVVDADGAGAELKLTVRFGSAVKKVLARFVSGGDGD